ncbi:Titin [Manis pentadactyla]|nr:Titin [Manis pentadactyla]
MTRFLPSRRSRAVRSRSRSPSALVPRREPAAAVAAEAAAGAERSPGVRGDAGCTPGQALCNETVNASPGIAAEGFSYASGHIFREINSLRKLKIRYSK